jgi:cobalt-zinc-cadmium efflux system outer membrane protein
MSNQCVMKGAWACLCALASLVVLSGCASSQSLARSLRLSTIARKPPMIERELKDLKGRRTAKREADEDEAELAQASAFDGNADDETSAVNETQISPRSPSKEDGDILTVLLAAYGDETETTVGDESSDRKAEEATPKQRLQVPPELPGSDAQSLRIPPFDPNQTPEERRALMEKLYPELPPIPDVPLPDPSQPVWTLAELEQIAWEHHPALMQAAAQVEVARGGMIQAGLHPNPLVGWEQDTIANGIQGYKGPYMMQEIVTGGKLKLARSAAAMNYENAQVAYQRTRIEVSTRVRSAYYDLLVSQQRRRMLAALSRFTEQIYRAQIDLAIGGQAAAYEPLQVRVFSVQARNAVVAATYDVIAASRRLGAATGMPDVDKFRVDGEADNFPAGLDYLSAKAYLLENHTDLRTLRNQVVQAQYLSRLEFIRPRVPNVNFYGTYQHASEVPPFVNSYNFQIGAPVPIFDRNQGNILSTQSSIIGYQRAYNATQNDLLGRLAAALARFDTARVQADNYRRHMLPDQVRTYRGVYSRYREGGQAENDNINFSDVIVAQQTLSSTVNDYSNVLTSVWQAYVDIAALLQVEDLTQLQAWFSLEDR